MSEPGNPTLGQTMQPGAPVLAERNLVRTQGGAMIHRAECHIAKRSHSTPWAWADRAPLEMVRRTVVQFGYRTCRMCSPLPDGRGERFDKAVAEVRRRNR